MIPDYTQILQKYGIQSLSSLQTTDAGKKVDLYARILSFKPVKQVMRGARDYIISLSLTDPTLQYNTITTNIFKRSRESLPIVAEDHIIVFHNIQLTANGRKVQLRGNHDTHFIVFDYKTLQEHRTDDADLTVYDELVEALANWTKDEILKYSNKNGQVVVNRRGRPLLQTDEILPNSDKYLDYVGMIVDVYREIGARRTVLVLTDYTENPHPYRVDTDSDDAKEGIAHNLQLQCTLFDDQSDKCPTLKFGDFVYLRNCDKKNRICLEIAIRGDKDSKSNVQIISEPTKEPKLQKLLERKRNHTPIIKRKRPRTPEPIEVATSVLRTTVRDLKSWTSIRDVLRQDIEVTGKYMIRAFISDYKPKNVKDWIRGWCSACQKTSEISLGFCSSCRKRLNPVYQFCLLLEDAEGLNILAYGFEEDAEELFDGIPAAEVLKGDALFKKFEKTMSMASNKESNETFDFGIKSYIAQSGERKYRICNTTFILDE